MINPGDKLLVGLSGGADSVFLMLALIEIKKILDFKLYAAHMNHCIRGDESDKDEKFVVDFCKSNNIKLFVKSVNIPDIAKKNKISEECAGRNERYNFFNDTLRDNNLNKIAVAHNMNDSVETVILNMIRGSSLRGLCGIRPVNKNIIRPIINISRNEIEEYLNIVGATYCTDSTNFSFIYTRNKIRHDVLNSMKEINASVIDTIFSNISSLRNDEDFICNYANSLNCIKKYHSEIIIDKNIFDVQHDSVKKRILINAFEAIKGNSNNITGNHLDILCSANVSGKRYFMPGGIIVTVSFDKIIFSDKSFEDTYYEYKYKPTEKLEVLPGIFITSSYCSKCDFNSKSSVYINADKINNDFLIVRNRRDGDKFIPYGMDNNKSIKKLFIEYKIPRNLRDKIPLILNNNEIVAVVPYRVSELYKITDKTKNILKIELTKEER